MVRFGILGAGNIAHRFAESLMHEKDAVLTAVSCRNPEKGQIFLDQFGASKVYGSHEELLLDESVDAIYLALPHQLHAEWAVKALNAHKAVLCEKPAALNAEEMQTILDAADKNNVLFMEAMKPRFVPLYDELKNLMENHAIGELLRVEASQCNECSDGIKNTYHTNPEAGGSLLDCGIYCASWIEDFLSGTPVVEKICGTVKDDVNYYTDAELGFNGKTARLECAFDRKKPKQAVLYGTLGKIIVEQMHRPVEMTVICKDKEPYSVKKEYEYDDFYGEIHEFVKCFQEGKLESEKMLRKASLRCSQILDQVRSGFQYTPYCLEVLQDQETQLQYMEFGSKEALELGNIIAELTNEYDREVGIRITRESDNLVLFQYMMDEKSERNIAFMEGKRKSALVCGHSSLWPYVENKLNGKWQELFVKGSGYGTSGGAFPIRVNGEWVATASVSGLHEGKDHELLIRAISRQLEKEVRMFPAAAV